MSDAYETDSEGPLERMLRDGGLDLDKLALASQENVRLQQADRGRQDNLICDVLWRNERGRELLELLFELTVRRRTWQDPLLIKPEAIMMEGIRREAENQFVLGLLDAIARAESLEPPNRE